jgi:hypothetical protein
MLHRLRQPIGAWLAGQHVRFDERADTFLQKKGVPLGLRDQARCKLCQARILSQQGAEQVLGVRR